MPVVRRFIRNILSSWAGYGITLVVGFCLAPFLVTRLGAAGYGIWTLIVAVTGYCGLLDLGLRSSVVRFVVRHVAQTNHGEVNRTLSSALFMLTGAGILALLATGAIYLTFDAFAIDPAFQPAAKAALIITGINVAILLPFSVFGAVLPALERYDVTNAITVGGA